MVLLLAMLAAAPVPRGLLPDTAVPSAYRLDLTVVPSKDRFSGHTEIDVVLKAGTSRLFLHGRELKVSSALARTANGTVKATYTQVDGLGVARLDFAKAIPKGPVTLVFDYDAPFGNSASGLYHVKAGDSWYAWTQFESIDARAAFPCFDQPGYKTPFTVSITTQPGDLAVSNAPETGTAPAGALLKHQFAATKPLPTYLMAFMAGPFAIASGVAAPTPERKEPMPVRIVATQPNKEMMEYAIQNTGPIVGLLEKYFGRPFPFPKLDQIATPVMSGAMENAGADIYGERIILLDKGASTSQKQRFGMVVAHELSHQWFGDLVTPIWWDDIWLNESFANWMGFRIGDEWQPDLKISEGALDEAFDAMNVDALKAGRPIHQPIEKSGEIDGAFDAVTYGKGGQVLAMIASYLGDEKFRDGVRLHLSRHPYGNASTDQFFAALADAAHDPRVLTALRSFVDQQGVPVVHLERVAGGLSVSQKRYAMLGTTVAAATWSIPLCVRVGATRQCSLLDKVSDLIPVTGTGAIMPNAGGTGYYRFSLPEQEWLALIEESAKLPAGEALALTDSLWAAFRAGEVSPSLLVAAAKKMAANPSALAAVDGGARFAGLRASGMIPETSLPAYRDMMRSIYSPVLAALGSDPKANAYKADSPEKQKLRSDVVELLAVEAQDKDLRAKLAAAAKAYAAGDKSALDQSLLAPGFRSLVAEPQAAQELFEKAAVSEDALFRGSAIGALGTSGDPATAKWLLAHQTDKRLRFTDQLSLLHGMSNEPSTRDQAFDWIKTGYDQIVKGHTHIASDLPNLPGLFCSEGKAAEIESVLRPKVNKYQLGSLTLDRAVERVNDCGVLMKAKGAEVVKALNDAPRPG
ncbi:MAG TPA: M1 family aminopeptidase [Myxococcales bacterium]|nr:M1 family aminopeptidase [Myxococcales bacterium]